VPVAYHAEGFDDEVCRHFGLQPPTPDLGNWLHIVRRIREPEGEVPIAVVGKYTALLDAYKSLAEALAHGGIANNAKVNLELDRFARSSSARPAR
jgi:CTP synthase